MSTHKFRHKFGDFWENFLHDHETPYLDKNTAERVLDSVDGITSSETNAFTLRLEIMNFNFKKVDYLIFVGWIDLCCGGEYFNNRWKGAVELSPSVQHLYSHILGCYRPL